MSIIKKTGLTERRKRWAASTKEGLRYFPSFRAARYFLEFGKVFKTNPVYAAINGRRSQKRIR